jgi:hypothetical protein
MDKIQNKVSSNTNTTNSKTLLENRKLWSSHAKENKFIMPTSK